MNNKKIVNIGLDIGIASVGWGVLDANSFEIIKHGVRLFPCMEEGKEKKLNNVNRREKRSLRRQINRTKNRKKDFIKFLVRNKFIENIPLDNNLIKSFTTNYINKYKFNILQLRYKGLKNLLSLSEIIAIMYWYLSNRGFHYEVSSNNSSNEENDKKDIEKEFKEDIDLKKTPIENQYSFFEKYGYYRCEFNRLFSSESYLKEIEQILNNSMVDKKLKDEFFILFNRVRSYEEGPGSKIAYEKINDPNMLKNINDSSFNRFYLSNNKLLARENMWESSIGKCIYDDENRAPKNSLTSELFNLLNDLNNITLGTGEKLNFIDKKEIIKISFENNDNLNSVVKYIKREYPSIKEINDIEGLRIDSKKQPMLTKLEGYHSIKKYLKKFNFSFNYNDIFKETENTLIYSPLIDEIITEFSKFKSLDKRVTSLNEINANYKLGWSEEIIEELANKSKSFSQTHAFSIHFMKEKMIPELLHDIYNQQEIISKNNFRRKNQEELVKNRKYFSTKWIDDKDLIASPTIKRGIRQTFNVINDLIKFHNNEWEVKNVVVEMARELNSKAEKEAQINLQKYLTSRNELLKSEIEAIQGELNLSERKLNSIIPKLVLYIEQKGLDAYTGEILDKNKVILDPSYTEIDHIIPYSQCFDDSQKNKVLTLSIVNSKKGQRTPHQFLSPEEFMKMKRKWEEWYISSKNENGANNKKKYQFLTSDKDYSKPENSLDFINRNLVDTRYITKEVLKFLADFRLSLSDDNMFKNSMIKTINGKMTAFIRKQIERKSPLTRPEYLEAKDGVFDEKTGKKNRIWNGHHAEDAIFIVHGALKNPKLNKFIEKAISLPSNFSDKAKNDFSDCIDWDKPNSLDFNFISKSLNDNMNNVLFSYMLTKKEDTIEFSNETLYGVKYIDDKPHKIEYMSLEKLNSDAKKRKEIFLEEKNENWDYKNKIPMQMHDSKTWECLKSLVITGNPKSPFELNKNGGLKIGNRLIKGIKIIKKEKDLNEVMKVQKDQNGVVKSFKESLNWFKILVLKNNKDKNVILPITILNFEEYKKWKLGKSIDFDDFMARENIAINHKYCELHRGSILCDGKNYYQLVGHNKQSSRLEIKPVSFIKMREYQTVNTYLKGWNVVEINSIGMCLRKVWTF